MSTLIVYENIPRVDTERLATLEGLSVADLHDALPFAVKRRGLMSPAMRSITPGTSFFGQAITVLSAPGDNLMMHCGLYVARPGDVLVVTNGGVAQGAMWGEHASLEAQTVGLAGVVIDGPTRDVAAIRRMGMPVWTSCVAVSTSGKRGPGAVNIPIVCCGASVDPGDIVVADEDGVIAFGPQHLEGVVTAVRARMDREAKLRERIRSGERHFKVFGIDGEAAKAGVEFRNIDYRVDRGGVA